MVGGHVAGVGVEMVLLMRSLAVVRCVGCFGADIVRIVDTITADGPTNATGVSLFGAQGSDDSEICGLAAFGNVSDFDEEHGVGSFLFAVALCEAANFVGIGVLPKGALAALTEFAVFSKLAGVGVERVSVQCEVSGRGVCGPCRSENSGVCDGGDVTQACGEACAMVVARNDGRRRNARWHGWRTWARALFVGMYRVGGT